MKKLYLFLFCFSILQTNLFSQNSTKESRSISVTGSADIKVQPDEIELEIVLKEFAEGKKSKKLETIEKEFFKILKKNNIKENKVVFNSSGYYWYYWWSYRNESYRQKRYLVKLDAETDFMSLMKDLDWQGVLSLRISNTTHSKLQEYRKEVKVAAVRAAKEKASYLLESIDEELGSIISIEEKEPTPFNYYRQNQSHMLSNYSVGRHQSGGGMEHVSEIVLKYEIKAKFEIAD